MSAKKEVDLWSESSDPGNSISNGAKPPVNHVTRRLVALSTEDCGPVAGMRSVMVVALLEAAYQKDFTEAWNAQQK